MAMTTYELMNKAISRLQHGPFNLDALDAALDAVLADIKEPENYTVFNAQTIVCKTPRPYSPCDDVRACVAGGCQYKPDLFALLNMPGAE